MAWSLEDIQGEYNLWKIQPNETLMEYYKRLAELRKGGILGTQGMMDSAKEKKAEKPKANSDKALGQEVVNESSSSSDGMPSRPAKPVSLEDMVRAKSGASFDPLQLFGMLGGPLGSAVAMGAGMLRDSEIGKQLTEAGYSDAEIQAMMDNPGLMQMELQMNPELGFGKDFDKDDLKDGKSVVERLFGGLFGDDSKQAEVPAGLQWAAARLDPMSNVTGYQNGMFTANIPSLGGNVQFERGYVDPMKNQQYWVEQSIEAIRQQEIAAAAEAARKAAESSGGGGSYDSSSSNWSSGGSMSAGRGSGAGSNPASSISGGSGRTDGGWGW